MLAPPLFGRNEERARRISRLDIQKTARQLPSGFVCGAKGIRTPDLFHAMEARYQLRHSPKVVAISRSDLLRIADEVA